MAHIFNSRTPEAEASRSVQDQPGIHNIASFGQTKLLNATLSQKQTK